MHEKNFHQMFPNALPNNDQNAELLRYRSDHACCVCCLWVYAGQAFTHFRSNGLVCRLIQELPKIETGAYSSC
jgi:hypothetical protein